MDAIWKRIEDGFREKNGLEPLGLMPGASTEELAALERHVGVELPAAVKKPDAANWTFGDERYAFNYASWDCFGRA